MAPKAANTFLFLSFMAASQGKRSPPDTKREMQLRSPEPSGKDPMAQGTRSNAWLLSKRVSKSVTVTAPF